MKVREAVVAITVPFHEGNTVQVAVDLKSNEMCFVSPPVLFERLGLTA